MYVCLVCMCVYVHAHTYIYIYENIFFHSFLDGCLNCSQFYSVTNHAAINILIHISWCTCVRLSLGFLSGNGSTQYAHCHLCQVMTNHFLQWLCSFTLLPTMQENFQFLWIPLTLGNVRLQNVYQSLGQEMISCFFNQYFPDN